MKMEKLPFATGKQQCRRVFPSDTEAYVSCSWLWRRRRWGVESLLVVNILCNLQADFSPQGEMGSK